MFGVYATLPEGFNINSRTGDSFTLVISVAEQGAMKVHNHGMPREDVYWPAFGK